MTDTKITMTGDPNICRHCDRHRRSHDIVGRCPNEARGFFESAFDYDGKLEVEGTSEPVCPHCGERDQEWWDGERWESEDTHRRQCHNCEKEYDATMRIEYSFSTSKIDFDAEQRKKDEEAEWRRVRHEACKEFPPGTRVRVSDSDKTIYKGKAGTVANRELRPHDVFVHVDLDPYETDGWNGEKRTVSPSTSFYAKDLEKIDG